MADVKPVLCESCRNNTARIALIIGTAWDDNIPTRALYCLVCETCGEHDILSQRYATLQAKARAAPLTQETARNKPRT